MGTRGNGCRNCWRHRGQRDGNYKRKLGRRRLRTYVSHLTKPRCSRRSTVKGPSCSPSSLSGTAVREGRQLNPKHNRNADICLHGRPNSLRHRTTHLSTTLRSLKPCGGTASRASPPSWRRCLSNTLDDGLPAFILLNSSPALLGRLWSLISSHIPLRSHVFSAGCWKGHSCSREPKGPTLFGDWILRQSQESRGGIT